MSEANEKRSGSATQSVDQPRTDRGGATNPARSAGEILGDAMLVLEQIKERCITKMQGCVGKDDIDLKGAWRLHLISCAADEANRQIKHVLQSPESKSASLHDGD